MTSITPVFKSPTNAYRRLLLLLALSLLATNLAAQTDQKATREAAEKLYAEADRLVHVQTQESLIEAHKKYDEALPLFLSLDDTASDPALLYKIGTIYFWHPDKQKAIDYWERALSLYRAAGDRKGEIETITSLGYIHYRSGELQKALYYFEQEPPLAHAVGDLQGEMNILSILGHLYSLVGDMEKALDFYSQGLRLSRALNDRRAEAGAIGNIGAIYSLVGEYRKALDYYEQELPICREVRDQLCEALALNNLAATYSNLGDNQKALDYLVRSLPLYRTDPTLLARQREATTLTTIGWIYLQQGEMDKAGENLEKALPLQRLTGNPRGESTTLKGLAWVYSTRAGKEQESLDDFTRSLDISRAMGDRRAEADILYLGALFQRNRTNLEEARRLIEAALAIVESLRAKITNQDLRSSYFATVQGFYELYIDILMRLHNGKPTEGYDGIALQISERGRARSLIETLTEANADIRQGVDPMLLQRERTLQKQLNAKAEAQMKLLVGQHSDAQARAIAGEIEALTTEFQQVEAQIRQTSPRYAALTQPQPLTLKEIQTLLLDQDTVLLEYSLGRDRSYLWAVTSTSITSYELPKRAEIESVTRELYQSLTSAERWIAADSLHAQRSGKRDPNKQSKKDLPRGAAESKDKQAEMISAPEAATRLSQMLLAPVAAQIGNKRLLIVADGALQYIPFGALPTPVTSRTNTNDLPPSAAEYRPLIIDHEIISLPSASTLSVLRQEVKDRTPAGKTLAVLADPVFETDDLRVKEAARLAAAPSDKPGPTRHRGLGLNQAATDAGLTSELSIPRLPGTRREATQILSLAPGLQSKGSFDFSASRQTATSSDLSQYRYVHFATHGFLDSVHPELSGIVLSMVDEKGNPQDGFLRAHEVFNLKLPAELVVLSACQTGLGKEVRGEGLVGLTRGFMYAGAPRVVVSLWSVDDESTAELMTRFYRGMLKDKLRPAAALRAAQVSLMKEKNWQSPYYWAAFTLQGEWR